MQQDSNDQDLRRHVLEWAIKKGPEYEKTEETIRRAEEYLSFVKGLTSAPAAYRLIDKK
jgi:hypothetical protein